MDRKFMEWCWDNETSDPETQEWRDELTPEEAAEVNAWDEQYNCGIVKLCKDILHQ